MFKPKKVTRRDIQLPKKNISREVVSEILPWVKRKEVIVLLGARQTGKTTILQQLMQDVLLPKKQNIYYFNLDLPGQREFFVMPDNLVDLLAKQRKFTYVLIDEVQRIKNPGLFLKGIYDSGLPAKLIVSGSSSLEIKAKIQEALTGRKKLFHIYPLSFAELTVALGEKRFNEKVLEHFLVYGSYPAVATENNQQIKQDILEEIFTSYIERDIKNFLQVENEQAFTRLVTLLSAQVGDLVNRTELSNSLGIHINTVDNYLYYLQQTFVIDLVTPFFRNKRKEVLKSPKPYFHDLGLRNLAVRNLSSLDYRQDKGKLLENFCYLHLRRVVGSLVPIHFWRTKAGAEVDFVLLPKLQPIPIEVKAKKLTLPVVSRSFRSFLKTYKPTKSYYLNMGLDVREKIENVQVVFKKPKSFIKISKF